MLSIIVNKLLNCYVKTSNIRSFSEEQFAYILEKYKKENWTDLKNQFETQLNKASSTDSIVSKKVVEKNVLKKRN